MCECLAHVREDTKRRSCHLSYHTFTPRTRSQRPRLSQAHVLKRAPRSQTRTRDRSRQPQGREVSGTRTTTNFISLHVIVDLNTHERYPLMLGCKGDCRSRCAYDKNETMLLICVFDSGRSPGYAYRVGRRRRTKPPRVYSLSLTPSPIGCTYRYSRSLRHDLMICLRGADMLHVSVVTQESHGSCGAGGEHSHECLIGFFLIGCEIARDHMHEQLRATWHHAGE